MPTFNTTDPKPGYVYDAAVDTWFPLAGIATQSLNGLTDVVITSASTNQVLAYDGTNWVNSAEAGDIASVTAGTGLTGGGASGALTLAIDTATTVDLTTAQTLSNKVLLTPEERTTISATAATGTVNFDASTQGILYYTTNASANWTLNVRGNSGTTLNSIMATGDSLTITFMVTQGSTAYYASALTIDGASVTPKYQGGTAFIAGNVSSIDAYTYSIVKTGSATYTVFASQTKFA
jgi:hypothetical protein